MTIQQEIAKIYVGYFGRSPDPDGFNYWISDEANGFTVPQIAVSFAEQVESRELYPYLVNPNVADPVNFVRSVDQNLVYREPDPVGEAFWVNELNEAKGSPEAVGAMVLNIINGAQNTAEFGPDKDIIENKTEVALYWAQQTSEIVGFEYELGSPAAASAKSVLDDVDGTEASVVAAKAETDAFVASGAGQSGETFVLTEETDGGAAFVGTAKNDTYIATDETLNTGDQLNGAGGKDTLTVQASGSSFSATPNLTSVENVVVQGGASNLKAQIDFTTSTGVEMGMLKDVRGEVEFVGVSFPFDLSVQTSNPQTLESLFESSTSLMVNYTSGSVSGTDDVQKLEVLNAGLASLNIEGIEHYEVVANGLNLVDSFREVKSVTVEGTGDLVAGMFSEGAPSTFDSTVSTGNMTIFFENDQTVVARGGSGDDAFFFAVEGDTENVDVDGGNGDDFFYFWDSLTESDTVDGGEGKDTLSVRTTSSAPASLVNALSGMEVLQFERPTTSTLDASEYDIDEFVFNGGRKNGQTVISGIESEDRFVFTSDQGNTDKTLNLTGERAGESFFMELRAAPNGSFTKSLNQVSDGNVEIVANANSGNDVSAVYFNDNISSVTIASTGSNQNANVIEAVDTGSDNYYAFGNEDGPTSFKIVGEQALTIAAREGTAINSSSDQSGFEEAVNVDASEFEAVLRIALSNSDDVLVGGSQGDIIYGLGGDDELTGGGGADQFRYVGTGGTDTILDFVKGEDKIGLSGEFDFENTNESFAGTTLASADYVDNRNGITEIGNADDFKMIELQQAFSTDQIQNDTGADVEAYVLVFNSTTGKGEIWHDANWSTTGGRDQILTFDNVEDLVGVQGFSNTDFVEFIA